MRPNANTSIAVAGATARAIVAIEAAGSSGGRQIRTAPRVFTPRGEVAFAGRPAIATAFAPGRLGRAPARIRAERSLRPLARADSDAEPPERHRRAGDQRQRAVAGADHSDRTRVAPAAAVRIIVVCRGCVRTRHGRTAALSTGSVPPAPGIPCGHRHVHG
jgi:hypothetical protein